jgi:site-specific DNA-methyltransferase (adenine-specific)|tara:strand:- start:3470 stop:4234 length:765 start_codon:yes stop_codon:yes gene_type:complete
MNTMPEKSIDLTVTSPPYDNLRTYKDSLEWGEHIWKPTLEELFRITKEGGVVVWVVGDATVKGSETGTSFKQVLHAMECGFRLHDTMIYRKANYMPLTHNRYEQAFEYMFVFSKGRPERWNPIKVPIKYPRERVLKMRDGDNRDKVGKQKSGTHRIKENVWTYKCGGGHIDTDGLAHKHPAPFSEQLANDHIESWSDEGDTVFDPFLGSGTTGKIAKKLNRNFIGIEKVEEYFKLSSDRINNASKSYVSPQGAD